MMLTSISAADGLCSDLTVVPKTYYGKPHYKKTRETFLIIKNIVVIFPLYVLKLMIITKFVVPPKILPITATSILTFDVVVGVVAQFEVHVLQTKKEVRSLMLLVVLRIM